MRIAWRPGSLHLLRSKMNYPAFILCCLGAMLALVGCDETTRPASLAPTAVVEILPTTTPYSEPAPTAAPEVSPTPLPSPAAAPAQTTVWRGLTVADEDRCSPYDPDDYRYSQSVETRIVAEMGGMVYGPYTGRTFADRSETDIKHIVARSEAHDSGLCAADSQTRKRFSSDLLNLTLAAPKVNRHRKGAKDAAEWLPDLNRCWFADRVVRVRQKYSLTIDRREAEALDSVLSGCVSVDMVTGDTQMPMPAPTVASSSGNALETVG